MNARALRSLIGTVGTIGTVGAVGAVGAVGTIGTIGAVALLGWTTNARAAECATDGDCPAGMTCLMVPCVAMPPCDPDDPDCTYVEPSCPEVGECVETSDPWTSDCETDADCPKGEVCEAVGGTACACPEGVECPECAEPTTIYGCVPGPCESDADCGEGEVCITVEIGCPSVASAQMDCPEGAECPPAPSPPELPDEGCKNETQSFCGPKWAAPCEVDADCGEGFACVAEEMCSCSGGAPTSGSSGAGTDATPTDPPPPSGAPEPMPPEADGGSGSDAPAPPSEGGGSGGSSEEPDCTCEATGQNVCELQEIECAADADCPDGWICADQGTWVTTPCPPPDPESGESDCPEPPAPEPSRCEPEDWNSHGGYGAPTAGGVDTASPEAPDPNDPNDGSGGQPASTPGPAGEGASGQTLGGAKAAGGGSSSTCAGGSAPLGLVLPALLALAALAVRRRRVYAR